MAVERIEKYRQKDGDDILKVILKPTKSFPEGRYFYADACDEELVRNCTWFLKCQKFPYVEAKIRGTQTKYFHQEKAFNILHYYPDYINHINGIEFDNTNMNLDEVTNQQNQWCKPSKGYRKDKRCKSFLPYIKINSHLVCAKCTKTEVEACILAYQLELQYEDYIYSFLKDRHKDLDLLDMERTGQISEDEAVYHHVCRYAKDNAWFYYRYNLADYFRCYHIPVPNFSIDSNGFMTHSITGQKLCPL